MGWRSVSSWLSDFAAYAGKALHSKHLAGALYIDGVGYTLSVRREVKTKISGNTRRSFLKAPKEAIYESRDRWRRRRRLRLSSLSSHARNCVPSDRDRQEPGACEGRRSRPSVRRHTLSGSGTPRRRLS